MIAGQEQPILDALTALGIPFDRHEHPPIASAIGTEELWPRIADQLVEGRLSFGSAERLMTHLGVTPGSVSALGLIHDRTHAVRVCVDEELKRTGKISFHPNINTATLVISFADFERFLAATGNPVQFVKLD